jgi:protein-tyrosine-phosphatase
VSRIYRVLFLSRENAARTIMAEALLRHWGAGRFRAFSAGTEPAPGVHALASEQILRGGLSPGDYQPKSLASVVESTPPMDFVFILHDPRQNVAPPEPPARPTPIVWPVPDPLAVDADADEATRRGAFRLAYLVVENRIKLLTSLRLDMLDRLLEHNRNEISAAE